MQRRRGVRLKGIKYGRARADTSRVPYYRHPDGRMIRLPELPENHPDFIAAYARAAEEPNKPRGPRGPVAGTLEHLVRTYEASPEWRALRQSTRDQRHRIGRKILDVKDGKGGLVRVKDIRRHHIEHDIGQLDPHPARNRLKVWRALMDYAVAHGWIDADPSNGVRKPKAPKSDGFQPWTPEDIETFRRRHAIGTEARLAMELCYWTGAASADVVRLGRQMVGADGWLRFSRQKTGSAVDIPLTTLPDRIAVDFVVDHDHLLAALAAAPAGRMLFLETEAGQPRSPKAFGQWLATHARAVGLPSGRSPHGLRKARLIAFAEAGWSVHQIMSWAGHLTPDESVLYTRRASRRSILEGTEQIQKRGIPARPYSKNREKP